MTLPIIQSLWIGAPLSNLEKLCVQSFLDHGHQFHLYTYGKVEGIPSGATIKDGNEILPASKIFRQSNGSPMAFSNWFRYELLHKLGGFWVDMDTICIKPFRLDVPLVTGKSATGRVNTAVIGVQPHAKLMRTLADACRDFPQPQPWDREEILYIKRKCREEGRAHQGVSTGQVGSPPTLTDVIKYFDRMSEVKPHTWFYPFHWVNCDSIFDRTFANGYTPDANTHAVHLWNSVLGKNNIDKNATFPHDSLIEQLKRKHKITAPKDAQVTTYTADAFAEADNDAAATDKDFTGFHAYRDQTKKQKNRRKKRRERVTALLLLILAFFAGWWLK